MLWRLLRHVRMMFVCTMFGRRWRTPTPKQGLGEKTHLSSVSAMVPPFAHASNRLKELIKIHIPWFSRPPTELEFLRWVGPGACIEKAD